METTTASLTPTIAYYIRRLLRQNIDQLKSVVASGAGLPVDTYSDFEAVLTSLYVEPDAIQQAMQDIEKLALTHQSLASQGNRYRREMKECEQKLFWLLGFKYHEATRQGKILIADDMAENLMFLARTLKREGYEVETVNHGGAVHDALLAFMPDVIILDVLMPGMSGFEVCVELKQSSRHASIPVMFVSTVEDITNKVKAFEVGGADYITKPYHTEEILVRLAHQIDLVNVRKRLEEQNVRLQAEVQERKQVEAQYRSLFENALDGMFQSSPEGRYIRVNQALANLYGFECPDTLLGTLVDIPTQLYVDPDRRAVFIKKMNESEVIHNFESEIYRKDSETVWQVKDRRGKVKYYEGIVRQVS
jgi:PAS domain S-box-containing protein